VFIRTTDKLHITPHETLIANEDIRREITTGDMTDMKRTVGVWESGGNEITHGDGNGVQR
jgi:hypothetical protein